MEQDLLDDISGKQPYDGKRPVFLTVLCILTFVGVGLTIVYNWFMLYTISATEKLFNSFSDPGVNNGLDQMYQWMKIAMLTSLVGSLICLAGAIFMMRLRKFGYYIYIVGQVLPLIASFLSSASSQGSLLGGMGIFWVLIGMIFPIGFIVMYGLNYKYLR